MLAVLLGVGEQPETSGYLHIYKLGFLRAEVTGDVLDEQESQGQQVLFTVSNFYRTENKVTNTATAPHRKLKA